MFRQISKDILAFITFTLNGVAMFLTAVLLAVSAFALLAATAITVLSSVCNAYSFYTSFFQHDAGLAWWHYVGGTVVMLLLSIAFGITADEDDGWETFKGVLPLCLAFSPPGLIIAPPALLILLVVFLFHRWFIQTRTQQTPRVLH